MLGSELELRNVVLMVLIWWVTVDRVYDMLWWKNRRQSGFSGGESGTYRCNG
jgi:hypothetical protein